MIFEKKTRHKVSGKIKMSFWKKQQWILGKKTTMDFWIFGIWDFWIFGFWEYRKFVNNSLIFVKQIYKKTFDI